MNWSEIKEHATCVESGDVDYQEGWRNGEVDIDYEDLDQ